MIAISLHDHSRATQARRKEVLVMSDESDNSCRRAELTVVICSLPCALSQREVNRLGVPERRICVYKLE